MENIEIIAEIGVNHNGDYNTAVALMHEAKRAGADTVKFQLFSTERIYPKEKWDEMKRLELSRDDIDRLRCLAPAVGVKFLCTPDDISDLRFLKDIGVERIKIGSSNITNPPLLREAAKTGLPIILSTGACSEQEVNAAVRCFTIATDLTLMHCLSAYPPPYPYVEMNLNVVKYFHSLGVTVGFSDHTIGSSIACLVVALGATVFEKHLTLDKLQPGPDHMASADPFEMANYVHFVKETQLILGDGIKRVMPCEEKNRREYERFVRAQYEDHPAL